MEIVYAHPATFASILSWLMGFLVLVAIVMVDEAGAKPEKKKPHFKVAILLLMILLLHQTTSKLYVLQGQLASINATQTF